MSSIQETNLKAIADAIRAKDGTTASIQASEFPARIAAIETGITPKLVVTTSAGATVTATKGSKTVSGTAGTNGTCTLDIPEAGEWSITASLNTTSDTQTITIGTQAMTLGLIASFADSSWSDIIAACQSGNIPDIWSVGDSKIMHIKDRDYQIDIIGKNHDNYADGSGKAPLTFQLHNLYATEYAMYDSTKNLDGWNICDMRLEHLPDVLSCMPSEIQNAIREVNKLTGVSTTTTITTTADKLFLLSEKEVLGGWGYSRDGEGDQYAYYQESSANKRKTNITNGDYDLYWLRSPNELVNGNAAYCAINSHGNERTRMMGYTSLGIAPAFCF